MALYMMVENRSDSDMPIALGVHPYHPVTPSFIPTDLSFEAMGRRNLDRYGQIEEQSPPREFEGLRVRRLASRRGMARQKFEVPKCGYGLRPRAPRP
jgi:galactose mutarotase-like enzyme